MNNDRLIDVTEEFVKKSTPGKGSVSYEKGFDFKHRINEKETALWLLDTFGGEIIVLKEKMGYRVKNPDYKWNNKFWELKDVSSRSSLENGLRKAIKQINQNAGGIIIDISLYKGKQSEIYGVLNAAQSLTKNYYLIIKNKKKLSKVYLYK